MRLLVEADLQAAVYFRYVGGRLSWPGDFGWLVGGDLFGGV